jgi:hypothetical protein
MHKRDLSDLKRDLEKKVRFEIKGKIGGYSAHPSLSRVRSKETYIALQSRFEDQLTEEEKEKLKWVIIGFDQLQKAAQESERKRRQSP